MSGDHLEFDGGGACRFCPERVTVEVREEAPSLASEWGLVGFTPVARRLERTGCGGSGCDYSLTAWWAPNNEPPNSRRSPCAMTMGEHIG